MAKRQKVWAQKARAALRETLGGVCASCPQRDGLEFDCIEPRGDAHHRMDTSARVCFYRKQHREGNLQMLCPRCHAKKTAADIEKNPF